MELIMNTENIEKLLQYVYVNTHLQVEVLKLREVISANYLTYERLIRIAESDEENESFLYKCANDYFMNMLEKGTVITNLVRGFINNHFEFFKSEFGLQKEEIPYIVWYFWYNVSKNDLGRCSAFFIKKLLYVIL
jgi:hypothetical protein